MRFRPRQTSPDHKSAGKNDCRPMAAFPSAAVRRAALAPLTIVAIINLLQCTANAGNLKATAKVPLPTLAPKAAAIPHASPPAPLDVWDQSEIEDAKRICTDALQSVHAEYEILPPIKNGPCGAPAPIRLISLGKEHPVKFNPPPTLTCQMLAPLNRWIKTGLQPLAESQLDNRVTAINVMTSYACRTRYGRKGAKISEHAFANAIDIGGFEFAANAPITVLAHWGPTRSDLDKIAAAGDANSARAKTSGRAEPAAGPPPIVPDTVIIRPENRAVTTPVLNGRGRKSSEPDGTSVLSLQPNVIREAPAKRISSLEPSAPETSPSSMDRRNARSSAPSRPQSGLRNMIETDASSPPLPTRRPLRQAVQSRLSSDRMSVDNGIRHNPSSSSRPSFDPPHRLGGPTQKNSAAQSVFLRSVHRSACQIFGTTLGPEANEAHRNHFHFDMLPRKNRHYCE